VVRRLEGIPLAIELAAARMRLLPVTGLLPPPGGELDLGTGDVDVPDRQRTLRKTIAWSYGLLGEDDRRLARCLAVLRSTWTLSAAEAVAGPDVLDGVGRLVEHSLLAVQVDGGGEPRLRMLRTVQAFLDEELRESGDRDQAVQRLTDYVVRLTAEAGVGVRSGESRVWRARGDAEIDAVRAVLDQAVAADDAELAVKVAAPLTWYWWSRGLLVEMLQRAERVAALPSANDLAPDLAGVLLWCRGTIRIATGRLDEAGPLVEKLVADAEERDDGALLPLAHFSAALVLPVDAGEEAEALLVESARLFEGQGEHWGQALALAPLGGLQLLLGRPDEARASHERALAAAEAIDDDHMRAVVLDQLAADCLVAGDLEGAARMLCRAAWTHLEVHDDEGVANCLDAFAALAVLRGEPAWALRCLTAADRVRRVAGVVVWPFLKPLRTQLEAMVLEASGSVHDDEQAPGDGLTTLAAVREHFLVAVQPSSGSSG
jgi:tetratricopeptide (TPR) repeat protein